MTEAYGFLQLLVLELEVFEPLTEHQAGSEAGLWRPFGLQPHSHLKVVMPT